MKGKIKYVEKGWGEDSDFHTVGIKNVSKIIESKKPTKFNADGITEEIIVYQVFIEENVICEYESNSGLTIGYFED